MNLKFNLMPVKYLGFWEPNPSNRRKSELHRIDCWRNCVNRVADLLLLVFFFNVAFDLESERHPSTSMKSISRQLNWEIMLGVNRLYIYTGPDRVSLDDMTLKCFREHFRKIVLFLDHMFSSLSAKYKFEVGRLGLYNMWWLPLSLIVNRYYDILSIELFLLGKLRILLTINKYPGMCCSQVSTSSECGLLAAIFFF